VLSTSLGALSLCARSLGPLLCRQPASRQLQAGQLGPLELRAAPMERLKERMAQAESARMGRLKERMAQVEPVRLERSKGRMARAELEQVKWSKEWVVEVKPVQVEQSKGHSGQAPASEELRGLRRLYA